MAHPDKEGMCSPECTANDGPEQAYHKFVVRFFGGCYHRAEEWVRETVND
jgi:hypothetical protein